VGLIVKNPHANAGDSGRIPGSERYTGFGKGRGSRDQIANIFWIIEKAREFQKKHLLLLH